MSARSEVAVRVISLLLLLAACKKDKGEIVTGEGLFEEGCPAEDHALAREIGVDHELPGPTAVGTRGDFLLANDVAAFVITEPDKGSTYYYYGGIIADAAAMSGCEPHDDELDEIGLVIGELNLADTGRSNLRAFRGETAEVIADGSDGEAAIVRITGYDDRQWLVEYELIRGEVEAGGRPLSDPFGVEITVDYILEPGSPVLRIEIGVENTGSAHRKLLTGALLSFWRTYDTHAYASAVLPIGGLGLRTGMPWVVASDGTGAYAYAAHQGNLGYTHIAGIDIAVDIEQALTEPIDLDPGEREVRTSFLSVGPTDGPTATAPLLDHNPRPLLNQTYTLRRVQGTVVDPAGAPIAGARVALEANSGDGFGALDEAWTDASGAFSVAVPDWVEPWDYQLVATAPGRDRSAPVALSTTSTSAGVQMGPAGAIHLAASSPARVVLVREDGARVDLWTDGDDTEPLPPGAYTWTATRGYEYAPATGTVDVPDDGEAEITVDLVQIVDTAGWRSLDTHVHSEPSPDSRMDPFTQLLHGAAHGVDTAVFSEHEHIVEPPAPGILEGEIAAIGGEEMTATMPEHMTMFPVTPDGTARGGIIEWYGQDIAEIWAAMKERSGGGVNIFNHPGYLDLIQWDYVLAEPVLDDPTVLGLSADSALWDWNLDGVEVMNGHGSPFADGNRRFEKWMSMVNAGHPVVPIGSSDDHGGDETGFPRTYYAAADDGVFDVEEIVQTVFDGGIVVSTGAFARVDVAGAGPGELATASGTVDLAVHIEAIPEIDVTHAVVFVNCDQVARIDADDPHGVVKIDALVPLEIDADAQIVVAAFGAERLPIGLPQFDPTHVPRVLTNAIYVDADADGTWTPPGGRICSYTLD